MKKFLSFTFLLLLLCAACDDGCNCSPIPNGGNDQQKPDPDSDSKPNPDDSLGGGTIIGGPVKFDIPHYIAGFYSPRFSATYWNKMGFFTVAHPARPDFSHWDKGAEAERYEALCAERGDTAYHRVRWHHGDMDPLLYDYPLLEVTGIDLIVAQAWNERPTGSSWADLCWLRSLTPKDYIASGYDKFYDWNDPVPYFSGQERESLRRDRWELTPVSKRLDQCTAEDLRMLLFKGFETRIYLTAGPEDLSRYDFTLIFTFADGSTQECPVEYNDSYTLPDSETPSTQE